MRSIFVSCWSLDDALNWRSINFEPHVSMNQAFDELRALCISSRVQALGLRAGYHPKLPLPPLPWKPFAEPPCSESIPSAEWEDYSLALDSDHRVSGLNFTSVGLAAWTNVEFDRDPLVLAWLPVIEASKQLSVSATPQSPSEAAETSGAAEIAPSLAPPDIPSDAPVVQRRPRTQPENDLPVRNRIKTVLAAQRQRWSKATERPALRQQARLIHERLRNARPPLALSEETIRKILSGKYKPMIRMGISPDRPRNG